MSNEFNFKQLEQGIEIKAKVFHMGNKVWVVLTLPQTEEKPEVTPQNKQTQITTSVPKSSSSQSQTTNTNQSGQKETTRRKFRSNKYQNKYKPRR